MNQKKDIIKSIVVLFVICLVVSAALAVVNHFTAPVSEANAIARENEARREMIPEADDFIRVSEVKLPEAVVSAYHAVDKSTQSLGYVFTVQGKGFDGTIKVMCAIAEDGTILRCKTLDVSSETKTLGGKTANPEYTDQYTGKDRNLSGVNGVSGATITSTAYRGCVDMAFEAFRGIKEAGK